jgi:magnesium-protoporphyrin IX monomethyl ester (oxidative) cyclase
MHANPELITGRNRYWIRFFVLAVFATMYIRDHLRADFYEALGFNVTEYDLEVFRKTSEISKQVFPMTLDLDHPRFKPLLDRMYRNTAAMEAAGSGIFGRIKRGFLALANGFTFAQLYFLPVKSNTPPVNFRLEPAY